MELQSYFVVENDVVTNIVMWDGCIDSWSPPSNSTMLICSTTIAKTWKLNNDATTYVLTKVVGEGQIGFTWDGVYLTTNKSKPTDPVQPTVFGAQTL